MMLGRPIVARMNREIDSSGQQSGVIELAEGGPYAFSNPYRVDGRVSWHASGLQGWAPMNSYLVRGSKGAILIDPGLSIHRKDILRQVGAKLGGRELDLLLLRQGEFDSICNVTPLVNRFAVRRIYGEFTDAFVWADVVPEPRLFAAVLEEPENRVLRPGERLKIEGWGDVEVIGTTLRLLNTLWLFDERSGTLFTSDSFSYLVGDDPGGPWVLDEDRDHTTAADVAEHLATTRYWWVRGADVTEIRSWLTGVFATREVETIAPAFGRIIHGRDAVLRHRDLLDEAIATLGAEPSSTVVDRPFKGA